MICIRGLSKTYADGQVGLSGVDLDIGEGMFGLLGPNGAGKTTLLSMLVLACEPTAGNRTYAGLDGERASNRPAIRAMIGYLPQDFAPIAHLTGLEYLTHCARLRRLALSRRALKRRALDLLDGVDLAPAAHRRAGEYSGGMRRRLGIAQALIHTPRLLIVDEPTSGLDPEERIRFRNMIAEVAERTAVLLSTHIVEDVEATCPRLGIIAGSRLLFDGEPSELLRAAEGRLWELPGSVPPPPGSRIVSRGIADGGEPLLVVHAEQRVAGGRPRQPTLEEAYSAFLVLQGHRGIEEAA